MKFGRLVYRYIGKTIENDSSIYNIGDNFQTYAIDNIYRTMGIDEKDIVDINACEMQDYNGEYVIVLMAGYASHYKRFHQLPTSDKIIPYFFSFEMSDENCDDIVPYLQKHVPIGCRDEATMNLLRRKGIQAFTSGCLTITLPKRQCEPKCKKTFFVDIPSAVMQYIPKELWDNYEIIEHEGIIGKFPMTESDRERIDRYANKVYMKYKQEATLVVTSRLHAAAPCLALGIPVVLVIDNIDSRFSWLDKLIPIYDSEHYDQIDWNPQPVDIEPLKEQIISCVCHGLQRLYDTYSKSYDISTYWENRHKVSYNHKLYMRLSYLREKYNKEDKFTYIIWGAGVHGKLAYSMISEMFPQAELIAIVDNYMEGKLFNVKIIKPIEVYHINFDYAVITTHPGRIEAVEILNNMGKQKNIQWCYYISKDIPEEQG